MIRLIVLMMALVTVVHAAEVVTDGSTTVSIVFYVKDGVNSPYQGLLQFTPAEYAAITPDELNAKKLEQFNAWKINLAALQAAAAANPPVEDAPQ